MKQFLIPVFPLLASVVLTLSAAPEDKKWFVEKFGGQLTNAAGKKIDPSALNGKLVGVYFSASWCGPCRNFTPQLVKFYHQAARKNNL